jgi:hypothetical protein
MTTCKWIVEIEIADIWIADGFNLDPDALAEAIDGEMIGGFAFDGEVKCKIVKRPTLKEVAEASDRHVAIAG